MKTLRKRLIYVIYLTVVVLVALEIGVRIWGYAEHYIYDPIYRPYAASPEIPFVHQPNLRQARARGQAICDTDALGLRSRNAEHGHLPRPAGEYRIGIVGDSITFGEGIPHTEDVYCEVLADLLNQRQESVPVRVFNYGVSAYSVKEMTATVRHRLPEVAPDLMVLAIIPGDFDLSRTPSVDRYGYNYNRRRSGFLARDSSFKRALRKIHLSYLLRDLRARGLARKRATAEDSLTSALPAGFAYVREFAELARDRGVSCLVMLLPTIADKDYGLLPAELARLGIPHLDLSWLRGEFTRQDYLASRFDRHPSALVHARIAEELARYILNHHLR